MRFVRSAGSALIALTLTVPVVATARPAAANASWIDTSNRAAVVGAYEATLTTPTPSANWTGDIANCLAGTTSADFQASVIARINFFRAMAGIDPVTADASHHAAEQEAALMMAANGMLSHGPPPSWKCYTAAGDAAAGSSNLYLGVTGPDAIDGYIDDSANVTGSNAGHRLWLLYPALDHVATGDVVSQLGNANALYVFGSGARSATRQTEGYVAWPPPGFVPEQITPSLWSVSLDSSRGNFTNASVTVTVPGGGTVSAPVVSRSIGYGDAAMVFQPAITRSTTADTTYHVQVTGASFDGKALSFAYDTTLIPTNHPPTIGFTFPEYYLAGCVAAGARVATVNATDVDGDLLTYSLVSGSGSSDNALFTLQGAEIRATSEIRGHSATYHVRVRVQDPHGAVDEQALTLAGKTTNPCAPDTVATSPRTEAVEVRWTPPSNSGGSAVTGYRVQNTATSNICYAAANQRSCIVKAVPGQRATFEVVTTTANGYSLPRVTAATVARYAPTQLAGGGASSCARLANGAVRCWGANTDGQLGVGSISAPRAPQDVPGLGHIAAVTAGGAFTCAITDTTVQRQVRCWGRNSNGQLGNGTLARSTRPAPVTTSTGARLVNAGKIAAGATFACAVISPGSTGRVQCWGANAKGQLGDGSTTQRTHPVTVKTSATTTLLGAIDVAAGGNTACALLSSGAVRCWGANGSGQLGNGATIDSRYAVPVKGLDGIHAKSTQLAVGDAFGCIRLTDGTARCWGANGDGQLGDSSKVQRKAPVKVNQWGTTLAHIGSIAAGGAHACATSSTNGGFYVLCWGRNASGELGLGSGSPAAHPDPGWAAFTGTTPQVACGAAHTLVVAAGNQPLLQAWGANSGLQLGVAGTAHRTSPVPVTAV